MRKEELLPVDSRIKVYFALAVLGVISLMGTSYLPNSVEAAQIGETGSKTTPTLEVIPTVAAPTFTRVPEIVEPELEIYNTIGFIGEDIQNFEDISRQTVDFDMEFAPNAGLIKYLYDFKEIVQVYATNHEDVTEDSFTQGKDFSDFVYRKMSELGYRELLDSPDGQISLDYLADYYKNSSYEDHDGNREIIQCMESQIFASAARSQFIGAPVFLTSHPGDALALASDMLNQLNNAFAPSIADAHVVKFPRDRFDINIVQPADTVAIRYGNFGGHVVTILAKALNQDGETMVLVFGSNRIVVDGELITNGIPELRWETSEFFSAQNETSISQAVIIRSDNP